MKVGSFNAMDKGTTSGRTIIWNTLQVYLLFHPCMRNRRILIKGLLQSSPPQTKQLKGRKSCTALRGEHVTFQGSVKPYASRFYFSRGPLLCPHSCFCERTYFLGFGWYSEWILSWKQAVNLTSTLWSSSGLFLSSRWFFECRENLSSGIETVLISCRYPPNLRTFLSTSLFSLRESFPADGLHIVN